MEPSRYRLFSRAGSIWCKKPQKDGPWRRSRRRSRGLRGMLDMPAIGQPKWPSGYRVGHHEMILSSMIPSQPGSNPSRRGLSADRLPITTSDSLSERTAEQTHGERGTKIYWLYLYTYIGSISLHCVSKSENIITVYCATDGFDVGMWYFLFPGPSQDLGFPWGEILFFNQ